MTTQAQIDWCAATRLMGVLNVTPDSFSGDGLMAAVLPLEAAVAQAREFAAAGADILDIGGESTRPGSQPVSAQEEMDRVVPVIEAVRKELDIPISIDTYKSSVAAEAISAGADMINDVWACRADNAMAATAAQAGVPIVLMHNRSKPNEASLQDRLGGRYIGSVYQDLIAEVCKELLDSVHTVLSAGVTSQHIILDPGIGFGKTVEQNLVLINRLNEICSLGYPVLLGPSRKSFIGYTLNLPVEERFEGTAAAVAVGILRGANIIRAHDVAGIKRVIQMTNAILHAHG